MGMGVPLACAICRHAHNSMLFVALTGSEAFEINAQVA
jgi:hypothetical protein